MADVVLLDDVISDLKRIQSFDPNTLVQKEKLGIDLCFEKAVEPARRLVTLFEKLPSDALVEFPDRQLNELQSLAKQVYNIFDTILKFKSTVSDAEGQRSQLIEQLTTNYQAAFNTLFPMISYAVARKVDFNALAAEGRAAVQEIRDETSKIVEDLKETSHNAATILEEVREAAAEQGVTQMAKYFGDEAEEHGRNAGKWLVAAIVAAIIVGVYAFATLFLYRWFVAENAFQSAQIVTSKLLVFGVLIYGLFQCVRSYSAHRHNQVTNKHRQNALMTYKTLAEAGNSPELRDAVLQHAAAAIYAPNDTGYLKGEERGYGAQSLLALLPRSPTNNTGAGG